MSNGRTLINASVLSLQDTCILYPCCKNCVSRLFMRDSRYSCKKCGFTCEVHNISYRYRLSFSVAKDSDILRLSVFGSCLDPYFGVSAGFLQRFVEEVKQEVGDRVQKILIQAVEDCFVGRSFIFGLRLSRNQMREYPWFAERKIQTSLNSNRYTGQFVACQIALPNTAVVHCTVISYFKKLLQAVPAASLHSISEQLGSFPDVAEQDSSTGLTCFHSSLAHSGQSFTQESKEDQCIRPWEHSPGIITSSAEEYYSFQQNQETTIYSQWEKKSPRSQKNHCILNSSYGASLQSLPSNYNTMNKGEKRKRNDSSKRENSENPFENVVQSSFSSMSDISRLSLVKLPLHYLNKSRSSMQGDNDQSADYWGHVFGRNDEISFSQGKACFAKKTETYNSLAWEELPFSESLSEFIRKVENNTEWSTDDNICNTVQEDTNNSPGFGTSKFTNLPHVHDSSTPESSNNLNKYFKESGLHGTAITMGVNLDFSSGSFGKGAEMLNKDNGSLYANALNGTENETLNQFHSPGGESNSVLNVQVSSASGVQKKETGVQFCKTGCRMPKSVIVWESHEQKQWEECSDAANSDAFSRNNYTKCAEDESTELNSLHDVVNGQIKLYCRKDCTADHEQCDSGHVSKEHPLQNNCSGAEDVYNASADLFNSSRHGSNVVEGGNISLPLQSPLCVQEHDQSRGYPVPQQLLALSLPVIKGTPVRCSHKIHNRGLDDSDSEFSDSQDFIPNSQSTPVSKHCIPLQTFPVGVNNRKGRLNLCASRSNLLTLHKQHQQHTVQRNCVKQCKSNKGVSSKFESDFEEVIPSSVTKNACISKLQRLTKRSRNIRYNYCKIKGKGEADQFTKRQSVLFAPKPKDYYMDLSKRKASATVEGFKKSNDSEIKERISFSISSPSTPSAKANNITVNCSVDLFADSLHNSLS